MSIEEPKEEEKKVDMSKGAGDISNRIVGWAMNELATDIENDRQSAEDALKAIAIYQISIAAHKLVGQLEGIQKALLRIADKVG